MSDELPHGRKKLPEYRAWRSIIDRCYYPSQKSYPDYGGRGIRMCDTWRTSFDTFLRDIGRKPSPQHTIERINNDGHYEPGNVRWATRAEQANNKRSSRHVYLNGERMILTEAARRLGVHHHALQQRFRYRTGWKIGLYEEADYLSRPAKNDSTP